MGAFKDIDVKLQELRDLGYAVVVFSPTELYGADPNLVEDRLVEAGIYVIESLATEPSDSSYDDSMDGDAESALASAGFGTDEDYGYQGEE